MAENMDSLKGSLTAAYTRWRPKYHLQPPFGWMNDPCGLGYDPGTGLYHVGYQWNPDDSEWGNIAWGVAWSLDLCTWKVSSKPSINPESDNNSLGVFTGCLRPTNLDGQQDGVVTICYTSVHNLPIHHTLPYTRGSERIHLATSTDHGRTWNPFANNPIVPQPPSDLDVIAWRDPYVAPWCSMDRALGKTPNESLYGIVSGGIRGRSPTTFLYSVASNALDMWEYLGPLVDIGLNYSLSRWSGDNGVNWEVANFVSLADGIGHFHDFLIMGVEGCVSHSNTVDEATMRSQNAQMWMCGTIEVSKGRPSMRYKYGGRLDHGSFYAGNSFWDPISRQQVIFGWILEEDLPKELRKQQEWAGLLSVPRVLKCIEMESVCGALKSTLDDITCMEKIPDERGTYTLRTLAAIPDRRLEKVRSMPAPTLSLGRMGPTTSLSIDTKHFELDASFSVKTGVQRVGISILHSSGKFSPQWFLNNRN
jgi:beta-fructofuranosidase